MAYIDSNLNDPEEHFKTVIFTGDGTDNRAITVGFQPNITWVRQRTDDSGGYLVDSTRGNNAALQTTNTNAQGTFASMTFTSTGITVSGNENLNNENAHNYVSWHWKESSTAGIDVVEYTGNGSADRSISHSLGTEPDFIIAKIHSETMNWPTYSKAMGNGVQFLDITDAWTDHSSYLNYWYTSGMSSSNFGIGDNDNTNKNTATVISYLFSNRQGFSKFAKYTGNGNADGPFVYTGFRPAWVMIKRTDTANDWNIQDSKRTDYNGKQTTSLQANTVSNESTVGTDFRRDILSNGFKIRNNGAETNASGGTYVYLAFAEAPFVNSNGVPCNAR